MKRTFCVVFGSMLCAGLAAGQATTNTAPPAPADAPAAAPAQPAAAQTTETPPAKAAKKAPAKKATSTKPKYELHTTPLKPGPAMVIASNVNVRGQARLNSEVLGRVNKGQEVTVLEEITLKDSGPEEPSAWARILLPTNINGWVNSQFVDPSTKEVKPRRLNVRGGPGENYSLIGRLQRGEVVKEVRTQGAWIQIEPPTNAYAFVAAQYLKQEAEAPAAIAAAPAPATTEPPATTATVPEQPAVAPPPTEPPAVTTTPPAEVTSTATNPPAETLTATNEVATTEISDEPPPPRIVQREGVVRGTLSIQAPTKFELFSPESKRVINYLYSSARDLDLRRYKGLRIIVTGEEGLDERWRNTPVINIQRIQVIE